MNRCPDLVVCLKRDLQCLRPEASLVLIYRPNVAGMKGRVDLATPVNRTPDLWCGSTIHYHSILFGNSNIRVKRFRNNFSGGRAGWKCTRIYNPQRSLRVLMEKCRIDSSQLPSVKDRQLVEPTGAIASHAHLFV
ncbi:hypothetical protein TNCV_5004801 [Trichonephila clavipes]|uniref:Uncharacterized protein n=1 Tax=Trichonephila clavipes TaxID=2585209 RepID=A0A8X6RI19_TRICX|nr:hypothetical protein TNCV_5004801 [Trichonephila clavipes]